MDQSSVRDSNLARGNLFGVAADLLWPGVSRASDPLIDFGVSASSVMPKEQGPHQGRLVPLPAHTANPGEQLWLALEHELQEEESRSLQQAFRHRLEIPEELP